MKTDAACMFLVCAANGMAIQFKSDVFGIKDDDTPVWGETASPEFNSNNNMWEHFPIMGAEGVSYSIDEDANEIAFHTWVQLAGNSRARSGAAPGTIIDLGDDLDVHTTPNGINIKFSCTYSMSFTLSTETIEVEAITAFGSNIGTGNMSSAFAMTLAGGDSDGRFIMGGDMTLGVQWSVTSLKDLTFFFTDCNVVHGEVDVPVIKDSCYAGVANTHPVENTSTYQSFAWQIFKGLGQDSTTQTVTCTIQMCRAGSCARATSNADCPDVANYEYNAGN